MVRGMTRFCPWPSMNSQAIIVTSSVSSSFSIHFQNVTRHGTHIRSRCVKFHVACRSSNTAPANCYVENAAGRTGSRISSYVRRNRHDKLLLPVLDMVWRKPPLQDMALRGYLLGTWHVKCTSTALYLRRRLDRLATAASSGRCSWLHQHWPWPCSTASRMPNLHRRGHLCSLSRRTRAAGQLLLGLDTISCSKAGLREWGRTGVLLRSYSDTAV